MKLSTLDYGPLVTIPRNGFPIVRGEEDGKDVCTYKLNDYGVEIAVDNKLAGSIRGTLLMRAGIKFDSQGRPVLVEESDPEALQFPPDAVLVASGYNHMRPHLRFECNDPELGVLYTHDPAVSDNWSRRSFLAVMRPGTEVSFVVLEPTRSSSNNPQGVEERKIPLLRLNKETGRFDYFYSELPFMGYDNNDWMKELNRTADDEWKRAPGERAHRRGRTFQKQDSGATPSRQETIEELDQRLFG